ncbi:hypothetical protein AGMMS50212_16380 [Spirochaetia bacterium]|nr:hypothetical protein AGMMS50212_16380 [Spirochaetia bacterium]
MRRSYLIEIAHNALKNPDKSAVDNILNSVNLTLLEREIIIRSEIDKINIETICNTFQNWNKKSVCSYSHCKNIKQTGMIKIGQYITKAP